MAKLQIIHSAYDNAPEYTEIIEVRVWGMCGTENQPFYIGSGMNSSSSWGFWAEILYSVAGAQLFYTRSIFMHVWHPEPDVKEEKPAADQPSPFEWLEKLLPPEVIAQMNAPRLTPAEQLEELANKQQGSFGFSGHLPGTSLRLDAHETTYEDNNEEIKTYYYTSLEISADASSVFGRTSPGERTIGIQIPRLDINAGVQFMRELLHEVEEATQGKHPNPASYPLGSSRWLLTEQLNQQAYDRVAQEFYENYFDNPLVAELFGGWLEAVQPFGRVLDVGCGRGDPVIRHLLKHGMQVTGSDLSPEMLRLAGEQYPQASFIQQASSMPWQPPAYDAACSFNSLLYLDPIDLLNSIHRLYSALKPGGMLFLYGYDAGPDWRGEPFHTLLGQWMWSWHYGMQEAAGLLEEHGYFEVLEMRKVKQDPGEAERLARELEKQKQEDDEYKKRMAEQPDPIPIHFSPPPPERSPYAYVIIARRI